MTTVARFLAFAFASADLLVELDASRRVVMALGAQGRGDGRGADHLVGRHIADLVAPKDRATVTALFAGMGPGERRGPIAVQFVKADGSCLAADLFGFALPDLAPNISCALAFTQRTTAAAPASASETAMAPEAFRGHVRDLVTLAAARGRDLSLALVEVNGLIDARAKLGPEDLAALMDQARQLIARYGADGGATSLSDERFAVVQDETQNLSDLASALNQLLASAGSGMSINAQAVPLSAKRDPLHQFRAVRAALDCFLQSGLPPNETVLRRSFAAVLDETARSAGRLGEILS